MFASLHRTRPSLWWRMVRGFLLILTALSLAPASVPAAQAAEPIIRDHRDPDARVHVVIRKIIVHNDLDWGDGEVKIDVRIRTNGQPCGPLEDNWNDQCGQLVVGSEFPEFPASDTEAVFLNRYIPSLGDLYYDPTQVNSVIGIPIRLGNWYGLSVRGREIDPTVDDQMGTLDTTLTEDGRVRFGTFTERSVGCIRPTGGFCAPNGPGAFSVEYEIRPAILPDLWVAGLKVLPLPGSNAKLYCAAIRNTGPADAGPFNLTVQVDGVASPQGTISAGGMEHGTGGDLCVEMTVAPGQHRLTAIVDPEKAVDEVSETNNRFEEPYNVPQAGAASSPAGQPPVGNAETSPATTASPAPTGPTSRPTSTPAPAAKPSTSPTPKSPKNSKPTR